MNFRHTYAVPELADLDALVSELEQSNADDRRIDHGLVEEITDRCAELGVEVGLRRHSNGHIPRLGAKLLDLVFECQQIVLRELRGPVEDDQGDDADGSEQAARERVD
jgi:hypothetical protein